MGFYGRYFATCSLCRALEVRFEGQGFSSVFWWQGGPSTTIVESPSTTPSAPASDNIVVPSHSGVTIPSVPRNRKVVWPDTSATSSKRSSSLSLIENVDMGNLIEDLMSTKVPLKPTAASKNFLPRCVCHSFVFSIRSMNSPGYFFIHFFLHFWTIGWGGPCLIEHHAKGSHGHWYHNCQRAWELAGTSNLHLTLWCSSLEQTILHIFWGFVCLCYCQPSWRRRPRLCSRRWSWGL